MLEARSLTTRYARAYSKQTGTRPKGLELRLKEHDARQHHIDRNRAVVRETVLRYFLVNDNPMPGASAGGVILQMRCILNIGTVKWRNLVVTVYCFAISGFKTMCLDGVEYYVEAIHIKRLCNLCRVENLKVNALSVIWTPDTDKPEYSRRALLAALKGAVAIIDDYEVLILGPGSNERNECLVVGTGMPGHGCQESVRGLGIAPVGGRVRCPERAA